jgi:hypothetical protein
MTLKTEIAIKIRDLYEFHSFEIKKERVLELADLLILMYSKTDIELIDNFCLNIKIAKYGIFYPAPSNLTTMFRMFLEEQGKKEPPKNNEGGLQVIPGWTYK